jgi:cobalt/nickel transport system permease protein
MGRASTALRATDARIKLTVAFVALVLAIAAQKPATPLCLSLFALISIIGDGDARRRLGHTLTGLVLTAGIPALLIGWMRGPDAALLLGARVLGATSIAGWLMATTPLDRLQAALVWLHVPHTLVELVGLAWRYAGVFRDNVSTAIDAQKLRLGWSTRRRALRSAGTLAGSLLGRAVDQTAALGDALVLRGYRGRIDFGRPRPLGRGDAHVLGACLAALSVSLMLGSLPW